MGGMSVSEAVASRRSVRSFQDRAVPLETVTRILEKARMTPSGCNFQPWEAVVLTGAPLKELQETLLASQPDNPLEYDFSAPGEHAKYKQRLSDLGAAMYGTMSIGRENVDARTLFSQQNILSFGAPVLLLCHFPKFMKEPQWSDVGMWLQTIMLLVREEGLDTCPQEWMGIYGRTIKTALNLPQEETLLFCGIAIGYREADHPVNNFERQRVSLAEHIRFEGF